MWSRPRQKAYSLASVCFFLPAPVKPSSAVGTRRRRRRTYRPLWLSGQRHTRGALWVQRSTPQTGALPGLSGQCHRLARCGLSGQRHRLARFGLSGQCHTLGELWAQRENRDHTVELNPHGGLRFEVWFSYLTQHRRCPSQVPEPG